MLEESGKREKRKTSISFLTCTDIFPTCRAGGVLETTSIHANIHSSPGAQIALLKFHFSSQAGRFCAFLFAPSCEHVCGFCYFQGVASRASALRNLVAIFVVGDRDFLLLYISLCY